jgi:putative transposase
VPNFSGGPKPKLVDADREELKRMLVEKDAWTLRGVRELIREKFNVEYSEMQVWRICQWRRKTVQLWRNKIDHQS